MACHAHQTSGDGRFSSSVLSLSPGVCRTVCQGVHGVRTEEEQAMKLEEAINQVKLAEPGGGGSRPEAVGQHREAVKRFGSAGGRYCADCGGPGTGGSIPGEKGHRGHVRGQWNRGGRSDPDGAGGYLYRSRKYGYGAVLRLPDGSLRRGPGNPGGRRDGGRGEPARSFKPESGGGNPEFP